MERIEDRSKALSYIGIEIAEALKYIPAPVEEATENPTAPVVEEENVVAPEVTTPEETVVEENVAAAVTTEEEQAEIATEFDTYLEETRFEAKPSLWQRFKNSKFVRTLKFITSIRIRVDYPALPEGKNE